MDLLDQVVCGLAAGIGEEGLDGKARRRRDRTEVDGDGWAIAASARRPLAIRPECK